MPDNVSTKLTGKLSLWAYERLQRMSAFVSAGCCQARSAAFWAEALAPASDAALALAGFEGGFVPPCPCKHQCRHNTNSRYPTAAHL
jgi:hypothetical protein